MSMFLKDDAIQIREVWNDNLEAEMALIREVVDDFPYVAMDTEFPGIVCNPVGTAKPAAETNVTYETMRANVDLLKMIQLGLTFSDEKGNLPSCGPDNKYCIWQFNFRDFDPNSDMHAKDSIELLRRSGIDFAKNSKDGVDLKQFGELFMSSGVVLNDDVQWLTFHGTYDFGYLLKLLSGKNLPETESKFLERTRQFFPRIYDVKCLMKYCNLHGGLEKLARHFNVERVGVSHQAGSDSLLTSCTFRKLKEKHFTDSNSMKKYLGFIYGLDIKYG